MLVGAQNRSIHKHSEIIKEITGERLTPYSVISDLDFCLEKRYANSISEVWKLDDAYVTLSQCAEIENQDIQRKISDKISNLK